MHSTARLVFALTITCLGSALALAAIHGLTEAPIQEQKRLATMRAVQEALPPFDNDPVADTLQIILEELNLHADLDVEDNAGAVGARKGRESDEPTSHIMTIDPFGPDDLRAYTPPDPREGETAVMVRSDGAKQETNAGLIIALAVLAALVVLAIVLSIVMYAG